MKSLDVMKSFIIVSLVACLSAISLGGVVPVVSPFYAGSEQTETWRFLRPSG